MSVVHDRLRSAPREPVAPAGAAAAPKGDDVETALREIARREQALKDGIRRLQEGARALNAELEAARRDLDAQKRENAELRRRLPDGRGAGP